MAQDSQPKQKVLLAIDRAGLWVQRKMNEDLTVIRMKYRKFKDNVAHQSKRIFYCHGQFACQTCSQREWGSGNVAIEIGLTVSHINSDYQQSDSQDDSDKQDRLHEFTFEGFRQKCLNCKRYATPKLTMVNCENLLKTVQNFLQEKWQNKPKKEFPREINNSRAQHIIHLCEACKKGKCRIMKIRRQRKENRGQLRYVERPSNSQNVRRQQRPQPRRQRQDRAQNQDQRQRRGQTQQNGRNRGQRA